MHTLESEVIGKTFPPNLHRILVSKTKTVAFKPNQPEWSDAMQTCGLTHKCYVVTACARDEEGKGGQRTVYVALELIHASFKLQQRMN